MATSPALSRRSVIKSAALLAGAAALGGCGTASGGTSAAKVQSMKPGTLTIMSPTGEITPQSIAAFQKAYPKVKVTQINTDPTRQNAMLAAGNPPDLVRDAGTDVTPYIATAGLALNLDDYFAQSSVFKESDIMPVNDAWRWNGKEQGKGARYGIAKDWSQDAMWWYDTDLWSASGLAARNPNSPAPLGRRASEQRGAAECARPARHGADSGGTVRR